MLIINDFATQDTLQKELVSGERLLWSGKPKAGIIFRASDVFLIPFSIFWFGFAIFWESGVVDSGAPFFFMIWGIPFLLVGMYMTIGRFFYDKANRSRTQYGITNNRIIIRSGVFKPTVQSFNIRTLHNLSIDEKADGSGTIKLNSDNDMFSALNVPGWPGNRKPVPALEFILDVRNVYNLILKQQHDTGNLASGFSS